MKYLILLALLSFNAQASVYKCEINGVVTYSQTPCADDAELINVNVSSVSGSSSFNDVEAKCLAYLKRTKSWKDQESVRIENSFKTWEPDSSGVRHVLNVAINAKNSYGAYAGTEMHKCFLNHSGDDLSKIQRYIW
ncbi:DUF4124 domain-containing protein [Rheinheimera sp. MMS21-TC3]|uniref:DUF4124 domain-containing protein n=1 Tax=Rheinheimera sp. MMS21-TC3 TaxID=3072790 RepID=UPI0028C38E66|nr:DUF4124 domain-containing protein [Rheinheimera sp. MMS21-TC3]WNO60890.1 DUF4124 domain-containing protein [Rheinheimera sp. MMS21-TC3]